MHPIVFCSISRLLMLYMYVIFISMTFCSLFYLLIWNKIGLNEKDNVEFFVLYALQHGS